MSAIAPYQPDWESLRRYTVPAWFQDAKFGIFIHWGVYAVPAFHTEWYPRRMYERGTATFDRHRRLWGPQSEFGYKEFIPLFTAAAWDPAEWVDLFARIGARYVVPVAEHHDGFAMYETRYSPWHAATMGPRRDVITELERAVRAAGLRFGVSSHRAFNWRYYFFDDEFDTVRPENTGLYGRPHPPDAPADEQFLADWFGRVREVIDRFRPDLLYFDFCWEFPEFEPYRPQVLTYYYNRALEWGREVVLTHKGEVPEGVAVYDIETGKPGGMRTPYWQTDTSVSWRAFGYLEDDDFKSGTVLVHDLVDIVSKGGNLLLNVGPRPDGTIPAPVRAALEELGSWLRVNGEAIYGTRPWRVYGEGQEDTMSIRREGEYQPLTAGDLRFTSTDNALYIIAPAWPEGQLVIRSLARDSGLEADRITGVRLVGPDISLPWRQEEQALNIDVPADAPGAHAYTFKVDLRA